MKATTDGTGPNSLSPRPDNTPPARTTATAKKSPKTETRAGEARQPPVNRQLTYKERLFVAAYLGDKAGNATAAARAAGYRWANKVAHRLVGKSGIREAIDAQLETTAMPVQEVLARLSAIAAASPLDFLDTTTSRPRLKQTHPDKHHTISTIRQTRYGTVLTTHDPIKALTLLGQYHGLWRHQTENATAFIDQALDEVEAQLAAATAAESGLENKGTIT